MQISLMDSADASSSSSSPSIPYQQIDIYMCTYTQVRGEKSTDGCVCVCVCVEIAPSIFVCLDTTTSSSASSPCHCQFKGNPYSSGVIVSAELFINRCASLHSTRFSLSLSPLLQTPFFLEIKNKKEKDVGHLEEMFTLSSGCLFTIFCVLLLLISLPKDVIDAEEENGHASGFRLEKEK